MKKIRKIIPTLALFLSVVVVASLISLTFSSCYVIQAQKMKDVKGTYKLTSYKTTDRHYVDKGKETEKQETEIIDEIEKHGYEIYIVVTGSDRGWYVYKDNETPAFAREVFLSYTTNTDDTSKYDYVHFKEHDNDNQENLGIQKNSFNQSKPAICEKVTGCSTPLYLEEPGYDKRWEKKNEATDLSYVIEQMGEMPQYAYESYYKQGVYQGYMGSAYHYYYAIFNTEASVMKAKIYYALAGTGVDVVEEKDITLVNGWTTIKIGEDEWTYDYYSADYSRTAETENGTEYYNLDMQGTAEAESYEAWVVQKITEYWTNNPISVCLTFVNENGDTMCDVCRHLANEHPCDEFLDENTDEICNTCGHLQNRHPAPCTEFVNDEANNGKCINCGKTQEEHMSINDGDGNGTTN